MNANYAIDIVYVQVQNHQTLCKLFHMHVMHKSSMWCCPLLSSLLIVFSLKNCSSCSFSGIGYAMVMVTVLCSAYYNVIIAYVIFYFFASLTSEVPWKDCNHDWNSDACTSFGKFHDSFLLFVSVLMQTYSSYIFCLFLIHVLVWDFYFIQITPPMWQITVHLWNLQLKITGSESLALRLSWCTQKGLQSFDCLPVIAGVMFWTYHQALMNLEPSDGPWLCACFLLGL